MINTLPKVKGKYRNNYDLSKTTWFQVGGMADTLFKPADTKDLSEFLKNKPQNIPVTVIGVGSNLLVRDGGIDGVVIRLGRDFTNIYEEDDKIICGAGALSLNVAKFAHEKAIAGVEFLSGIPGTVGGALAMNAGAYGSETSEVFIEAEAVDEHGTIHKLGLEDMGFSYRRNTIPSSWIFTKTILQGYHDKKNIIANKMNEIAEQRESSQPIRTQTGGSTFKNPEGTKKAWQLIDEAGCRGLQIGKAKVSEKHCNFLTNIGGATAKDIEILGEELRKRVKCNSNIELEWEIRRIGKNIE